MGALGATLSTAEVLTEGMALPGGYVQRAAPAFGTAYQPSATRPTLVLARVNIACNDNETGRVEAKVENANPPTVAICGHRVSHNNDAVGANANTEAQVTLTFIVPAGQRYQLDTANDSGAPAYTFQSAYELTL